MEHNANTDAVDSARKEIVWNLQNIQRRYFIETSYREIEEILNKFPELREEYKRFGKYVG